MSRFVWNKRNSWHNFWWVMCLFFNCGSLVEDENYCVGVGWVWVFVPNQRVGWDKLEVHLRGVRLRRPVSLILSLLLSWNISSFHSSFHSLAFCVQNRTYTLHWKIQEYHQFLLFINSSYSLKITLEALGNKNEQFLCWNLIKTKNSFLTTIRNFVQAQKRSFPKRM